MAFDKPTRNRLAAFVAEARRLITAEFTRQFQSLYGIAETSLTPIDQLNHLDDAGLAVAGLLRERIDYLVRTHPEDKAGLKTAVARLAREQAFTVLNRLAAVRMAEKRGLIIESVGSGYQSRGFKVFAQVARSGLGEIYQRYRRYLFCLFDELAVDLGVLFDRRSPQGLLFPGENTLLALLDLLNGPELEPLWQEDETIGWIYQYYNDPAERKKMREESAAPRNSRELAVRNQFFTPRYVVEFLTDNTLGRIWYEMTRGETRLAEQCRYLVRRPTEIFLGPGETAPELPEQEGLSQEELLRQPVYVPHRALKDPRDLRMLDPACGSMHFGLYAFDLYEVIYEEAWDRGIASLRADFPERESLVLEIPRLIIEHNIHGIDIDPRAVQIAGLSLWLRAQRSWQQQRLSAGQRPRIRRANIVCAEPMPGDKAMLREFIASQFAPEEQPAFTFLLERVFDRMALAGEAGSLLKIEEEISEAVREAKRLWQKGPQWTPGYLFAEARPKQPEQLRFDFSGISDEGFWETVEDRIYTALRTYAEKAESDSFQRRLFVDDTVKGFAFIDLFRMRYDVVLMNPPFGEFSQNASDYISSYLNHSNNILCPFINRAASIKLLEGQIGVIIDKTAAIKSSYSAFREQLLSGDSSITIYADLGWEVLDGAQVETVLITFSSNNERVGFFIKASYGQEHLVEMIEHAASGKTNDNLFLRQLSEFNKIPNQSIAYNLQEDLWNLFCSRSRFEPEIGAVRQGLGISDSWRWYRHRSEVSNHLIGNSYCVLANGGGFSPFYRDLDLLIYWADDGAHIKNTEGEIYGSWSRTVKNVSFYFKKGISYPKRTDFLNAHLLPKQCIFTVEGLGFFPDGDSESIWISIGLMNSRLQQYLINSFCGQHKHVGYVKNLPAIPESFYTSPQKKTIYECVFRGFEEKRKWSSVVTTGVFFKIPAILEKSFDRFGFLDESIKIKIEKIESARKKSCNIINKIQIEIDDCVFSLYGIGHDVIKMIMHHTKTRPELTPLQGIREEADNDKYFWVSDFFDASIGYITGRWDIRIALDSALAPKLPDPFAPLPICPPGMLIGPDGLPAATNCIASEEWLRVRPDANSLPREGSVKNSSIHDSEYPLTIAWGGILVDDPGHSLDIETSLREVFNVIWGDHAEAIEQEACELLGAKTLRDYFRKPSGFFADHLKRYSKSRRQAPIYWPLSTAKGSYTLWIYYHRLSDQTLHTALADFVDPKLKDVRAEISLLREANNNRGRLEELLDLEGELLDFRAEIERIIKLPWQPNLNDGVLITAAPLWPLFRLPKWQKDLKACWDKLEKGDYDWAHLAYTIWPKRVEEVCKTDRSIAIAHGLEHLCQMEPPKPKAKRGRKKKAE